MPNVRIDRDGDLVELVLASPPLNLFTEALATEVAEAVASLPTDARALLFRAEGKVFCGGVDVHWFQGLDASTGADVMAKMLAVTHAIEALPYPTIAVVHGLNLTIGLELSLACDLMWAAPTAGMGLVETTVGITPGAGGTQRLVARAGHARASDMVITGRIVPATDLHAWGVVNELRDKEVLLDEARAYAKRLSAGATRAMALGKQLLSLAAREGTAAADAETPRISGLVFETEDVVIGVDSLLANGPGKAQFIGR